jgi:hypothetical protein
MLRWLSLCVVAACSHPGPASPAAAAPVKEPVLALLPDGMQLVIEVDLARLKKNAVVGDVTTRALAQLGADTKLPGLPVAIAGSPLANADQIVLAAYGVGTDHAASITLLATKDDVPGGVRIDDKLVALGPEDWVAQVEARAAIPGVQPNAELLALRSHAMPQGAAGSVLRVTARLPFDARIALARETGLEVAPARLSVWADVSDDLAIVVDADAADPGEQHAKEAAHRLAATVRTALATVADAPVVRALGVPNSITDARMIAQGTWVRAIIAIGPRHLARAVERANALLGASS